MLKIDRENFGKSQAEMTDNWFKGLSGKTADLGAYIESRQSAYLGRWEEALRFVSSGSSIIDIGGGNLFPKLMERLRGHNLNYWFMDVDQAVVDGSRSLAEQYGFDRSQFSVGFNDALTAADGTFDAVFSSHCIEHSFDLYKTFSEINRVLRAEGMLLMAVPFGWEPNPAHPYFFGPNEWCSLVQDSGFEVRLAQVAREYPENGYDFFIAARKVRGSTGPYALNVPDYTKENYSFLSIKDSIASGRELIVRRSGESEFLHGRGRSWSAEFRLPPGVRKLLPIFTRHDWSGIAEIEIADESHAVDLYSWFTFIQPAPIGLLANTKADFVKLSCVGKCPASKSDEVAIHGFLIA